MSVGLSEVVELSEVNGVDLVNMCFVSGRKAVLHNISWPSVNVVATELHLRVARVRPALTSK